MVKVQLTKNVTNPFYGLSSCLELYQNASKGTVPYGLLDRCWAEVQGNKEKREMFFSLLFSIGDITARQHNIFRNRKVDSGGNAQRAAFQEVLNWLKQKNYPQFKKFLFANLFNEFTSFDTLLVNRVKTQKSKKKVEKVFSSLAGSPEYMNDLSDFVVKVIQGTNPANKYFLAKFLTRPRMSKRKGHKTMLPETRQVMKQRQDFLKMVSDKAGLSYVTKTTHIEFTGYLNWRKDYLGTMESVLFAQGKIKDFDKEQFKEWLNKIPASARYRVRCRLLDKSNKCKAKWGSIGEWFLEWEKYKDKKQAEVRVLEEKVRQGGTSQEDVVKLTEAKKEAKVTVGAENFIQLFTAIMNGTIDKVKVQPFLDKVNLPYNSLVFVDDSGSMRSNSANGFTAFDFAVFMATICLTKNPDDIGRSLLGFYSNTARLYTTMTSKSNSPNTILRGAITATNEPLLDPNKHFLDNLQRIRQFAYSVMTSNGTNVSMIPDALHRQIGGDLTLLEQLRNFPVWTIISDGNWNTLPSPEASMNDFMRRCQDYFGFKPFIIAIDVASSITAANATRFSGIENFMFIPPNPAQIEQLLTNFKDMDIMDVFTPLQSIHRSNRYEVVRNATI